VEPASQAIPHSVARDSLHILLSFFLSSLIQCPFYPLLLFLRARCAYKRDKRCKSSLLFPLFFLSAASACCLLTVVYCLLTSVFNFYFLLCLCVCLTVRRDWASEPISICKKRSPPPPPPHLPPSPSPPLLLVQQPSSTSCSMCL
jgi:hypothetical protein